MLYFDDIPDTVISETGTESLPVESSSYVDYTNQLLSIQSAIESLGALETSSPVDYTEPLQEITNCFGQVSSTLYLLLFAVGAVFGCISALIFWKEIGHA